MGEYSTAAVCKVETIDVGTRVVVAVCAAEIVARLGLCFPSVVHIASESAVLTFRDGVVSDLVLFFPGSAADRDGTRRPVTVRDGSLSGVD